MQIYGKGAKRRIIKLGKKLLKEVNNYLRDRHQKSSYFFLNQDGMHLTRQSINNILNEMVIGSRIDVKGRITPHSIRRTYATEMYRLRDRYGSRVYDLEQIR